MSDPWSLGPRRLRDGGIAVHARGAFPVTFDGLTDADAAAIYAALRSTAPGPGEPWRETHDAVQDIAEVLARTGGTWRELETALSPFVRAVEAGHAAEGHGADDDDEDPLDRWTENVPASPPTWWDDGAGRIVRGRHWAQHGATASQRAESAADAIAGCAWQAHVTWYGGFCTARYLASIRGDGTAWQFPQVRIVVHVEQDCAVCARHHGRRFPLDRVPRWPLHVGCSCSLEPVTTFQVEREGGPRSDPPPRP